MQLDKAFISRLEKLARLQLNETQRATFASDLNSILDMVNKLHELDTTGVEPLAYPTDNHQSWRPDEVGAQLTPSEALKNAPKHDGNFFRVPKVIE
ncbi:MAG: Asp-tRNA(Asn)/Glu-tRNA(Gln) amidotransferase subunit GatC [Saprospiraceae bacterium]|nr:Asp-tRNA(Asn)/Glu-tRNA(Gln) amidotransferase subunit GatC [Saprospiraceae bacterium]